MGDNIEKRVKKLEETAHQQETDMKLIEQAMGHMAKSIETIVEGMDKQFVMMKEEHKAMKSEHENYALAKDLLTIRNALFAIATTAGTLLISKIVTNLWS